MEQVIPYLSKEELLDLAKCVKWQPFADVSDEEVWLETVRSRLYQKIRKAGRSRWGNFWDTDSRVNYRDSVFEVAKALNITFSERESVPAIENKIIDELSGKIMTKMTLAEKEEWLAQVRAEAEKHGIDIKVEAAGLGAIGLAQLSGFGVYMAASTVLGAINGALGLGLGFGVFAGLSKFIAVVIGPIGALVFVFPLLFKMFSADPELLLPIVACIAFFRISRSVRFAHACDKGGLVEALKLVSEMDHKRGGQSLKELCDAQPENRRTLPYYIVRFLAGTMLGSVYAGSLKSIIGLTGREEREEIANMVISEVSRLAPEMRDNVLLAFLSVQFCSFELCYLSSPEDSETELVCVSTIAMRLSESLSRTRSVTV